MKKKYTIEEHREGLTELYLNQLAYEDPPEYMMLVLKEAIRKLEVGLDPKQIENWVVEVEKTWRKI